MIVGSYTVSVKVTVLIGVIETVVSLLSLTEWPSTIIVVVYTS